MAKDARPVGLVVIGGDVKFDLEVGDEWHTFRISEDTLADLDRSDYDFDRLVVFEKHVTRIVEVAKKLVAAGVHGEEIVIGTHLF